MDLTRAERRLEAIRKNRKCQKLSKEATKVQILEKHKIKMQAKKLVRDKMHEKFKADYESYKQWIAEKAKNLVTGREHVL